MNVYRLHRRVSRALARMSGISHRTAPAMRERGELDSIETAARGWTIPSIQETNIDSQVSASWRRRLLLARGQQIHAASVERVDRCAIAILDAKGIVISWHDHLPHPQSYDHGVVSRHMSQFYLPEDIALCLPIRHLSQAAEYGMGTDRGWRRRPGGEIFWGVTVIHSILLSDGELVGYSHVTRLARAPAQYLSRSLRAERPHMASLAMLA